MDVFKGKKKKERKYAEKYISVACLAVCFNLFNIYTNFEPNQDDKVPWEYSSSITCQLNSDRQELSI